MASAGGPRRGRLPDRSGGQRSAGRPDGGRHEGLAQNPEEDGREVGHLLRCLVCSSEEASMRPRCFCFYSVI